MKKKMSEPSTLKITDFLPSVSEERDPFVYKMDDVDEEPSPQKLSCSPLGSDNEEDGLTAFKRLDFGKVAFN